MTKDSLARLATRYWLAVAICVTVILAVHCPGPAKMLPRLHLLDIGVVVIMFLGSLKLSPERFKTAATEFKAIALSLIVVFLLAPLLSLGIGWFFGFNSSLDRLAVLLCSAQASTLATGIVLTEIAGGNIALAMILTVSNNLATTFLTPLAFRVFGATQIHLDLVAMGLEIALKIVLPVIVGQLLRPLFGKFVKRHSRRFSILTQLIILMYIYAGVVAGMDRLANQILLLPRLLGMVIAFHVALLVINAAMARIMMKTAGDRAAFVLCSSQKTLPAAILIWKSHLSTLPLGPLVAVSYHLTQLILDSIVAPGFLRFHLISDRKRTNTALKTSKKENGDVS